MSRWSAIWVLALAVLAGCGGESPQEGTPTVPTTPPEAMSVTVERTGGIAGVQQRLEISADGGWVYTDERQDSTEEGTLTGEQRARLLTLVSDPAFAWELLMPPDPSRQCADTFRYAISAGVASGSFDDCYRDQRPAVAAVIDAVAEATPL